MSSRSPQTRIDQFFASKKKRPISPSLKAEIPDKDAKGALDGSPSAKGTLDSYLVNSDHDNCLVKPANEDCGGASKHDPVKRNLTLEINLTSEVINRSTSPLNNCEGLEHSELAGVVRNVQQLAPCKIPDELSSSHDACDISTEVHGKETVSSASGAQNLKLRQFTADFLSLYCSELSSSVNSPSELKLHGNKRNGSPSLLFDNCKICKKKQCISQCNQSHLEENICLDMEYSEKVKSGLQSRPAEASSGHSGTLEVMDGKAEKEPDQVDIKAYSSFRKCNKVPNSSFFMAENCTTPGPSTNTPCTRETPKSLRRSSIVSPGDAFWNEAIQVVDGLFAPEDKVSVRIAKGVGHIKDQSGRTADNGSKSIEDDMVFRHLELNATVGSIENSTKDSARLPAVDLQKDVSPLPVRHFDFSFEKNQDESDKHQCTLVSQKDACPVRNGFPKCSSVNQRDFQSSSIVTRCKSLTDKQHNSEVKPIQSFPMPLEMDGNASDLDVRDDKRSLVSQEKGTGIIDVHTLENEIKGRTGACCSFDEADTPSSSRPIDDCLQLRNWLPSEICNIYTKRGISKLYPWQVACLQIDGVLQKRNLVYCASTSAGKSFVAEVLMLRRVISTGKMALLVLPYVSICAEKSEHLEGLLEPLGKHVRSFYGNQGGGTLPKDTSVAVCTIEKANSLVNRLLEEGRLSEVGIIVIDELHMVGDQSRGYLLELLLTKLRYAAGEGHAESSSGDSSGSSSGKSDPANGLQIIGMSATMPNVAAVADWLQAALYQTDFRPVPLDEYFKVGNTIYNKKMDIIRTIPKSADLGGKDPDHVVVLCNEVVQEGHSVLLFCSSRKGCESTARHVAKFLKELSPSNRDSTCEFSDSSSAIDALRRCPVGLDPILEETLPSGVAYHHAGLTVEEREIVETCYRRGLVRVLTATSTLAAGVNLPARRVIFRQPRIGRDFIDGTRYRQMAGRAGRTGIDTRGESILICKAEEVKRIAAMLNDDCPPLQSCLSEDKNGMTHAILEVVAGGIVQTASDIHRYVRCTLLNSTKPFQDVVKSAQDSLRWLCHRKLLEWNEETKLYSTTPLGRAAFGSSLCPEESLVVLDDLSRAREGFVLASDLHLVYLVTPINVDVEPDWELYYERFMELSALDQSVGNRVGVVEPFLMRMAHGAPLHIQNKSRGGKKGLCERPQSRNTTIDKCVLSDEQTLRVCRRFYVALMLLRLVQEVPVADVCEAFKVSRGMVQALQENAGRFALMVSIFCERIGWHDLEGLVAKFQNRVSFGVRAEIAELTTIPYVKGSRARALYKAGLRTPLAIAEASIPDIVKALFEYSSAWAAQEGSAMRHIQFGLAKKIKNGARKIILDQAEEARVAALSAFKSLGVLVPQLSRSLLSPGIDNSCMIKGTMSSGKDNTSSSDATEPKNDHQLASILCPEETKKPDHISLNQKEEKSTIASKTRVRDAQEVESIAAMQYKSNETTRVLVEASAPVHGPETNSIISGSENFSFQKLSIAGNSTSMPDEHLAHKEQERNREGNLSIFNSCKVSEKGPINACNVPGGFECFLDLWDTVREFYFDVHYTERNERNSLISFEIHGMAVCWENSPVYYVNLSRDLVSSDEQNLTRKYCGIKTEDIKEAVASNNLWDVAKHRWNRIAMIMERINVKKITWKLKTQIQVLKNPMISKHRFGGFGFECIETNDIKLIDNPCLLLPSISVNDGIDICIVAWILWPDEESSSSPNLEKEVKKRLSTEAAAAANRDGRWRNQMRRAAHNGCCHRVAQIRALSSVLWKLVISEELVGALTKIENPLVKVLADMEIWGIGVDLEASLRARHVLAKKLKELEKEAYSLAGMTFSLYTSADIANVLYRHLKLPIPEGQNKGKQHPSTDKHSLDLLRDQHPIVSVIKEHRTLAKLLNSTLGSICSQARLWSEKYTIHGHWLQTSTATGRLSMEEPNLQCVEHTVEFTIHHIDENNSGSSDSRRIEINARDFFIPTQDNWLLLTADYSQIELRLMAHFSEDSSLIELLSKPDGDAFTMMAAKWTGQQESAVSSQEREHTKRLVYGILYGMGANTLAEQLDCSSDEAAEKIRSFKHSFPGVSVWLNEAVASCRQKGYIETLKGRKRFLSNIKFGSNKEKAKAQRQAVNSICQGSAADIIKIAMINVHSVIVNGHGAQDLNAAWLTELSVLKGHCRILLQVHDELLLEVDPSLSKEAAVLLKLSMESAVSLKVPLRVKLKVGRKWGSLEPLEVDLDKEKDCYFREVQSLHQSTDARSVSMQMETHI